MKVFIIFGLFFLLPFISTVIVNSITRNLKWATYLGTLIFGILYPFIVVQINHFLNPPPPGPRCATGEFGLIIGGWVIGIPSLLFLQMIINLFYPFGDKVRTSAK